MSNRIRRRIGALAQLLPRGWHELRHGVRRADRAGSRPVPMDMVTSVEVPMLLDALALRLDPDACTGQRLVVNLVVTDEAAGTSEHHVLWVENSCCTTGSGTHLAEAHATATSSRRSSCRWRSVAWASPRGSNSMVNPT
ncbi:MAG: alkyl sulfatase C-terminal domain-containing protein [Microthrixaceae bacterium]